MKTQHLKKRKKLVTIVNATFSVFFFSLSVFCFSPTPHLSIFFSFFPIFSRCPIIGIINFISLTLIFHKLLL